MAHFNSVFKKEKRWLLQDLEKNILKGSEINQFQIFQFNTINFIKIRIIPKVNSIKLIPTV